MELKAKDYFEAAQERYAQASLVFELPFSSRKKMPSDAYALVIYLAGLAAECLLRAYRLRITNQFESRHKLAELFVESGLDVRLENHLRKQKLDTARINAYLTNLRAAVNELANVWRNSHRFATDVRAFRDFLQRGIVAVRGNRGSKASLLRREAKSILANSQIVLEAGRLAWT